VSAQAQVYDQMRGLKVIPVVAIDNVDAALPLADALLSGGLPVAEITFRTEAAAEVIRLLAAERPQLLLGAGTVLNVTDLQRAKDCGARFAVAPGLNSDVVKAAQDMGLPFAPGVMTPTDVEAALSLGLNTLKYFPAEAAGGVTFLKSLSAPYRHLGIQFIPTGGINLQNVAAYLSVETVLAVGGTWVAKRDTIASGRWDEIADNCRHIREFLSASA